jgi:hypothetical protein
MKTEIFLISVIILLFAGSAPLAQVNEDDTCEVLSVENVLAYSHVQVGVRVFTDSLPLAAVTIPLTWNSVTTSMTCDSIQWSDWFWNSPASTYSGGSGQENYIDSVAREIRIMAIWWWSPYLPIDDAILATLHFTVGEIDIIEPDGGEEWVVGEAKWIKWSAQCDWNVNDSVVVDSFRPKNTNETEQAVNFGDSSGRPIGYQHGETLQFERGYFVRAPQSWDSVMVEYSYDAGKTWNLITSSAPNDGQLFWSSIPDTPSDSCLIRITSKAENPISATSADFFTISSDTTDVVEEKREKSIPQTFLLHQNYPNPFNPSTKIEFSLPRTTRVTLDIYNIAGRKVKGLVDEELPSGHWSIVWNGEDDNGIEVASGVYLYRLRTSEYTRTKKMVIVR